MIMRFSAAVLAAQFALTTFADITFGKTYEAHDTDGLTLTRWDDFYMGATVAIPVVGDDFDAGDIVLKPGNYIDYGEPYVWSEQEMWDEYGSKFYEAYQEGVLDLEPDVVGKTKVWYWQNWDGADDMELITEVWGRNFEQSPANDVLKDRKWIMIPTGHRPQSGVHKFTVVVSNDNAVASYLVSFRKASDQKAKAATVRFNANGGTVDEYGRVVNLNSAVGELPVPDERTGYSFSGWWTDKTKGTRISASTKVTKAMTVYARWTAKKYKVTVEGGSKSVGTVSGAGSKAYNSKVTLVATPAKGYVFEYWDFGFLPDFDEYDYLWENYRQPKVSFRMPAESFPVWAVFVKAAEDVAPEITVSGSTPFYAEAGAGIDIHVDSISYASLGHNKTLPPGMSLKRVAGSDSDWRLRVADVAKLPRGGVRTVKLTAKNRSGKRATKSITVIFPNVSTAVDKGVLEGLNTSMYDPYELAAGIKFSWNELGINPASGWKISSITGIPGLKWDAKSQKMTGVPSKGGIYAATFTVTKGKTSYIATATFAIKALPAGVVGTFYGYCSPPNWYGEFADNTSYALWRNSRKVAVTVASSGKVTAKIGSVSLAGTGLTLDDDGNYRIYIHSAKKYSGYQYVNMIEATINLNSEYTQDALTGSFGYGAVTPMTGALNEEKIFARKNATATSADAADIAAEYAKLGKQSFFVLKAQPDSGCAYELACPNCVYIESGMKKTAFVKIEKSGKVTLSGSIAGTKVSGTTYLSYEYDQYDGEDLEVVARFFVGKFVIEIRGDTEYFFSNGSLWGRVWKK